jgi:hypothetical protein
MALTELWVEKSRIDRSIFDEMKDIAETSHTLKKQKEWITSLGDVFPDSQVFLSEIKKNREEMEESMGTLVDFGTGAEQ